MAAATNAQVQAFVNDRIRPRCEQIRALYNAVLDDIATIGDVYSNLTSSPTWTDNRTDGPPSLLAPSDILAVNTFLNNIKTAIASDAQLPIVRKACVRSA